MARFPSVPGGGPKSMKSPIYWTRVYLQEQRYAAKREEALNKFNEKWKRLLDIHEHINANFIMAFYEKNPSIDRKYLKTLEKLNAAFDDAKGCLDILKSNLDACQYRDLAKYATKIKKLALLSIELCIVCKIYDDISEVGYDVRKKAILINGNIAYCLI